MVRLIRLFVFAAAAMLPACAHAQETPHAYVVRLDRPQTQTVQIDYLLRDVGPDPVEVSLPAWRPGRYDILDPAGTIRWLRAFDGAGAEIPADKVTKATWRIDPGARTDVRVTYEMYANSIRDRTRHVDDSHAFLNPSTVFIYSEAMRDRPLTVDIEAPDGWRVASGLAEDGPARLRAPDYDILADSPIEIGRHDVIGFEVGGVPHEIVIWGNARYDAERLRHDFAAIVRTQRDVFGELPFERYVFMIHVGPGLGGGTEHYNSTIMQTRRASLEDPDRYQGFLGLVSHEFFHTWNVKRFRPAGLSPYDYLHENYTKLLWVVEGSTSYYDDLTLARAGLLDAGDYFKGIAGQVSGRRGRPGRFVQSVESSSFDAWIKFTQLNPDSRNSTVNFYTSGALATLVLDMAILEATGGTRSMDDVMRLLYERFPRRGPGFTPEDYQALCEEVAGRDLDDLFERVVRGAETFPLESALRTVGLELKRDPKPDPWDRHDDVDDPEPVVERAWLGITLSGSDTPRVTRVDAGGPAYRAGVIVDDVVLAVDGRRVGSAADLSDIERSLEPGAAVALTLFRRDELRTLTFEAGRRDLGGWVIRRVDAPTEAQMAAYETWLRSPWPRDDAAPPSEPD